MLAPGGVIYVCTLQESARFIYIYIYISRHFARGSIAPGGEQGLSEVISGCFCRVERDGTTIII